MANADNRRGTRRSSTTVRAGSAASPSRAANAGRTPMSVDPATRLTVAIAAASTVSRANPTAGLGRESTAHSPMNSGKTSAMSDWIDAEGYRANVGIVLMRDNGEVFLGQRTGARGWQFPQGGVRQGEHIEQALYRELREEIGLERNHVTLA